MIVKWCMERLCSHYLDLIEPAYRAGDIQKALYYAYKYRMILDKLMAGKYDGI